MLDRTHRFRRASKVAALLIGVVTLAGCGDKTGPDNKQNALRPAGPYARKILNLTEPFFWIAVVIGLGVLADTLLRERRHPLVLGPGAERQEGRRPRSHRVPEARSRQGG